MVLTAGQSDTARGQEALARLCEAYWFPLYFFVRRRGHSAEDARDLTQEFFLRLLAGNWVSDAERAKGRFRTFLLTACERFLANEWRHGHARKRGGGAVWAPLDTAIAESRYSAEARNAPSPDALYDRQWALTVLDRVLNRLEAEQQRLGKSAAFTLLRPALTAERGAIPYEAMAAKLGVTQETARTAVHRLRKRFRELFHEEIAETVASPDEVDEEIRCLFTALANSV